MGNAKWRLLGITTIKKMKLKHLILVVSVLFFAACGIGRRTSQEVVLTQKAGVRPDQFPVDTTPDDTDAFYTQESNVPRKMFLSDLKKFFGAAIHPTPLTSAPLSAGNTANLNSWVIYNGIWYYIDANGRSVSIGASGGTTKYEQIIPNFAGTSITITVPMPTNLNKVTVFVGGQYKTRTLDYTISGSVLTFTYTVPISNVSIITEN
jgi:hypothetical protein